jgi:Ca-activated chloride channel homolog
LSVAAVALGALSMPAAGPLAAEPGALMVIVDGSGSMEGMLERKGRQSKISLVRDSLLEALAQAGSQTRIGLAAFGHRTGGCNDVEIIRAPERPDVERAMAPLARIKPRGKGALVHALREAAKQLPESASPRTLLLIHDGADNCQQDVCAAGAELGAAGITVHVVSLGLPADEFSKIACLPQATGGRHFKVDSSEQVSPAIGEAMRAASSEIAAIGLAPAAPGGMSGSNWATSVTPPAPVPATRQAVLNLTALTAPGSEPLGAPLHWEVFRADDADAVLFDAWATNPVVPVAPGRYVVTASSELVSASQSVTVPDGRPTLVPIVLGAGAMRVRVTAQKTNAALGDAVITIASAEAAPLAVFKAAEAAALLPPGRFRVSAELGLVRSEQTVAMAAGRPAFVDIALNVGRLQITAGAAASEPALFIVMEDDPPRGRREVARSAATQAEFALPPGTYYVIARQGSSEARERLEIGSGDVVRRTLTSATGRLGFGSGAPGSTAPEERSAEVRAGDPAPVKRRAE